MTNTKHRFATYLDEGEHREMEVMRAELGLPQKQPNAMHDRQMIGIMRIAMRIVMEDIREEKRQAMDESTTDMPLASWEDVCDAAGVPHAYFERMMREDPRPSANRRQKATQKAELDHSAALGHPSDGAADEASDTDAGGEDD